MTIRRFIPIILLGFRYLASSIPIISLAGVAIGVGSIFSGLIFAICRNPVISNILIRWAFIGFSLVEISGFIGLVYSFLILYAFSSFFIFLSSYLLLWFIYYLSLCSIIGMIIYRNLLLKFFLCLETFFFIISVIVLISSIKINGIIIVLYLLWNSTFEVILGLTILFLYS